MTNQELHIYIHQGLQSVNIFQYADMDTDEFDMQIYRAIHKLVERVFSRKPVKQANIVKLDEAFENYKFTQDDFRILKISNVSLPVTGSGQRFISNLPSNYNHLLNSRSIIEVDDCNGGKKDIESPNRLLETEDSFTIRKNPFAKSDIESPLAELVGNQLIIHTDGFTIKSVNIDYVRVPNKIDTQASPSNIFEFPDATAFKIADYCITYLAIITEHNPQKIAFINSDATQ
jgi:hypothetical protein